jgi:hypothetical protein
LAAKVVKIGFQYNDWTACGAVRVGFFSHAPDGSGALV